MGRRGGKGKRGGGERGREWGEGGGKHAPLPPPIERVMPICDPGLAMETKVESFLRMCFGLLLT